MHDCGGSFAVGVFGKRNDESRALHPRVDAVSITCAASWHIFAFSTAAQRIDQRVIGGRSAEQLAGVHRGLGALSSSWHWWRGDVTSDSPSRMDRHHTRTKKALTAVRAQAFFVNTTLRILCSRQCTLRLVIPMIVLADHLCSGEFSG